MVERKIDQIRDSQLCRVRKESHPSGTLGDPQEGQVLYEPQAKELVVSLTLYPTSGADAEADQDSTMVWKNHSTME